RRERELAALHSVDGGETLTRRLRGEWHGQVRGERYGERGARSRACGGDGHHAPKATSVGAMPRRPDSPPHEHHLGARCLVRTAQRVAVEHAGEQIDGVPGELI